MNEVQIIEKEIGIIREKYCRSAIDILSDYNNENETRDGYRGRQIYELLQNADDCYTKTHPEIKVKFELRDNLLIIQNDGTPFSSRGIISLMHPNASSKHQGTIGCKGLGFRAVLNWANSISIYTEKFSVNFSEERAKIDLLKYKDECDRDHIEELDRIDRTAILSSASVSDDKDEIARWLEEGYSTAIVLHCNPDCVESIQCQLVELQFEELLFLKHIRNIKIQSAKANRDIEAVEEEGRFLIQEGSSFTDWTVWIKSGEIVQEDNTRKAYEIAIAYNRDEAEREKIRKDGVLYSYFKTEIQMAFPFLVHGTFELTSARDKLIKESKNNEILLQLLIDFIGEKGAALASESNKYNYDALKFLLPAQSLYFLDREYLFTDKLKEKIKHYKLFPTIADEYISIDDEPKYKEERFDSVVSPKTFSKLLKHCEDATVSSYIKSLGIPFYDETTLIEMLNIDADEYTAKKHNVILIELFRQVFMFAKNAPKLLIDSNGNRVSEDEVTVYHNPEKCFALPKWCKMRFLSSEMEKALCRDWNCDPRGLMRYLSSYGGSEYSFDRVLRELISQSKDNKEKTIELLKWLFDEWNKNDQQFETGLNRVNIQAISRDGEIVQVSKCFFGCEYENIVGERIISCLDKATFLADSKTLGFSDNEKEELKIFLAQLGAKFYPAIEPKELNFDDYITYKGYNAKVYSTLSVRGEQYTHDDFFYRDYNIQVADIDEITEILQKSNYIDILYWIFSDEQLNRHIRNKNEIEDTSKMSSVPYNKREPRYVYKEQMRSWLRKKFTEAEWLPSKSGKKVNCYNCTMMSHELSPTVEVLDIDYAAISELFGRAMKKEVEALLESLDVAEDIPELPFEKIYEILLKLPEIDNNRTFGKSIYTKLNLHFDSIATNRLINNNSMYAKFKKEGEVLAEIGGKYEYCPIQEVFYVGRKTYSDDILKNYPILALNRRAGDDKVQRLFCVKSIKNIGGIKVTPILHALNDEFQVDYQTLLPYIYAKRMDVDSKNKELNALKNSRIFLVEEARTEHIVDGVPKYGILKDFELIYADKIAYIKIPKHIATLTELKSETEFSSAAAEVITTILDIDRDSDSFMIIFERKSPRDIEMYFQAAGDQTLSVLNLAKEKFSQQIDYEYEFWRAISSASGIEIDTLKLQYAGDMPAEFDYKKINDLFSLTYIIELFDLIGIDVDKYNESALTIISLNAYFANKIAEYKKQHRDKYLCFVAKKLLASNSYKEDFELKKNGFNLFDPPIENSTRFNVANVFEEHFGYTNAELQLEDGDYDVFYQQLSERPVSTASSSTTPHSDEEATSENVDYKKLFDEITEQTDGQTLNPEIEALGTHSGNVPSGGHKHSSTFDRKSNAMKEIDGFKAEAKVYATLKVRVGADGSVEWVSKNGEKAGKAQEGNDSLGYDMRYTDDQGNVHYVEVKGTSSDSLEFILTKNEVNFAQAHKEKYELWFVFIKDGVVGEPYELGKLFVFENGEDFFQNHRFSVEQNDFKLKAKIIN